MIYHLIPLGSQLIPSHQMMLSTCHQKIEQVFNNYKQMWNRVRLLEFRGTHKTDLNKDKLCPNLSAENLNASLGSGIIAQIVPTTNWENDKNRCLEEFGLYYHNCLTARALLDIHATAQILPSI